MAKQITRRTYYTLVQHSAFVGKQDPAFEHGVEEWAIDGNAAMRAVVAVGGLVFNDYGTAHDAAFNVNYPESARGLMPQAGGTFRGEVDGMPIYVPGEAPREDARRVLQAGGVPQRFVGITNSLSAEVNLGLMQAVQAAGVDPADLFAVRGLWERLNAAKSTGRKGA